MNGSPIIVQLEIIIRAFHLHRSPFASLPGRSRKVNWVLDLLYIVCMLYPTPLLFWQVTPQPRTAVPQPHPAAHTTAPPQHHRPSLATDDQKQARSEGKLPVPEVRERRHRQSPSASQQQVSDSQKQRHQQVPQTGEKQQRPRRRSGERESRSRQERQQVSVSEIEKEKMYQLAAKRPTYRLYDDWEALLPI